MLRVACRTSSLPGPGSTVPGQDSRDSSIAAHHPQTAAASNVSGSSDRDVLERIRPNLENCLCASAWSERLDAATRFDAVPRTLIFSVVAWLDFDSENFLDFCSADKSW